MFKFNICSTKGLLLITIMFLIGSCKKNYCLISGECEPYDHHSIDTIDRITMWPSHYYSWDTARTAFKHIQFNRILKVTDSVGQIINVGIYMLPNELTAPKHYLKYVGKVPLFKIDSAIDVRAIFQMTYKLDTALFNKPIFEDHLVSNDSLFKTYVLKRAGVVVVTYYKNDTAAVPRWQPPANFSLDNITKAFNYYITDGRQSDYYFIPNGRSYPLGSEP